MAEYKISINQLATFSKVTDARKRAIVKQQKNPPLILVGRYVMAKARIKKAIGNRGDMIPVLEGIEELKQKNGIIHKKDVYVWHPHTFNS